ncbi:MAG: extracellular solute-binding protein [Byssovorax sp.]
MKRALVFLLFLAGVAGLLPGCSSAPSPDAPIRLWHAYGGDEEKALLAIVATWKGRPVETLALPFDAYASKLAAAIPIGDGPDLFIDVHGRLGDYRFRKLVAPAGDALEAGVFTAPAVDAVTQAGAPYAVPLSQKCLALFVNTDLVNEVPADLEGIGELAGKLPQGVVPLVYEAQGVYGLSALFSAFGGRLLDAEDHYGFVGPPAEQTVLLARSLIEKKAIPEDIDGALVTNLFRSGQAAFAISGPWLTADLGDKVHYRVAPLPKVRATGQPMRPLLTVESVMLSPEGAKRAEVRELARFLASPEAARIRASFGPTPSARKDVTLGAPGSAVAVFAEQAETAIPMPSSRAMNAVWDPANRAIRKVLRKDASAADALDEAKRRFDSVRSPLPRPASPAPALLVVGLLLLFFAVRAVKQSKEERWGEELKTSLPAYAYVTHAVLAVGVLVIVPLVIGAGTSLFAGSDEQRRYVGLANFVSILTARGGPLLASGSFYLVLLVTLLWTVCNIVAHVGIGLVLALLLSRPTLRLKALYRVLLIVPWAVPSYVTALAWKGMFNRQFGAVTGLLLGANRLFGTHVEPIAWFSNFATAFSANLATNIWLGFPFMMVVTLGALTGVPDDVLEAAKVDGATRFQRLRLVTLPIIRPTLMPAVILGSIWTFNMFNVVFLVSGGEPDGTTDILVSEAYRWAFTRENQYGYAAAYAVLIFLLLFAFNSLTGQKKPAPKPASDPAPAALDPKPEAA